MAESDTGTVITQETSIAALYVSWFGEHEERAEGWRHPFDEPVASLLAANTPEQFEKLLEPEALKLAEVMASAFHAEFLRGLFEDVAEDPHAFARALVRRIQELAAQANQIPALLREDLEWSAEVSICSSLATWSLIGAEEFSEYLNTLGQLPTATKWSHHERQGLRCTLLSAAAIEVLRNPPARPNLAILERLAESAYNAARWIEQSLSGSGISWRAWRDSTATPADRRDRILKYAGSVATDLNEEDLAQFEDEVLAQRRLSRT